VADGVRIVVIGGGPGGYTAALRAAQRDASVTLVEQDLLGGTSVNRGCVPLRALLASADALRTARRGEEFGFMAPGGIVPDLAGMVRRKAEVIRSQRECVRRALARAGVRVVRGRGRLDGRGSVHVDAVEGREDSSEVLEADRVIVAAGSEAEDPMLLGLAEGLALSTADALDLEVAPASLLIVGAGAVSCGFASFFSELGTAVTLVSADSQILPGEDVRLTRQVEGALRKRGIVVRPGSDVEDVSADGVGGVAATLTGGERVSTERVLLVSPRKPCSCGLGLETVGASVDAGGFIQVDERLETAAVGVYAVGDVIGGLLRADAAAHEGLVAADNCTGGNRTMVVARAPRTVYAFPQAASVGLSEARARERGLRPVTGTCRFGSLAGAAVGGDTLGFVHLVADGDTDVVLGATLMGPGAAELAHEVALAVEGGLTAGRLGDMVHAHPTVSEAVMEAARDVHGESVHLAG
jgi:dihydrolipoamide dehydrogenase